MQRAGRAHGFLVFPPLISVLTAQFIQLMRKFYAIVLLLAGAFSQGYANEGDTTVVLAHQQQQLSWYESYDTDVSFPDGTLSYRKIIMEVTLGKYACEGYDPSNPGEGPNNTGWCSDWDYDMHVIAMVPGGDTMELGRLITPYANSNFPRTPANWEHPYVFDVTDYYPILKDDMGLRVFYAGWSGGFTASIKFYFIEGTPARNVVGIDNLWQDGYSYGNTEDPIDNNITERSLNMPLDAVSAEAKLIITGHGGDSPENCAEFCKKWYQFKVNGQMVVQNDIWRDDCGSNFLYPQSGTWIYDRGNWCPGDLVREHVLKVPASIASGQPFTTDLDFQNYTSANNGASYKVAAAMFYYGDFNRELDAAIESIISPNDLEEHYRFNPICGQPRIKVKNYGGTAITTIKFEYGLEGQSLATYTWTNNLAPLAEADVDLPVMPELNGVTGDNNQFVARILEVNGVADEDSFNDERNSTFSAAPVWQGGHFRVDFKTSGNIQQYVNKVNWTIKDASGNIVAQREGEAGSTRYLDTVQLDNGCYELEVDASYLGYGLNFFNYFPGGYFRIYDMATGNKLNIPKCDLGSTGLAGNFGNGFTHYFVVQNANSVHETVSSYSLNIYPNPATEYIYVEVLGQIRQEAEIQLINTLGQSVFVTKSRQQKITIPTQGIANGVYTLVYNTGDAQRQEKIVISR